MDLSRSPSLTLPAPRFRSIAGALLVLSGLWLPDVATGESLSISPPAAGEDATPVLTEALAKCRGEGIDELVLEPGVYHLHPDSATERFVHVSNHDDGLRRTALPIWDFDKLTISGSGAKLVAHGQAFIPITIYDSSDIRIQGLTLDWADSLHMQGTVVSVDAEANSFVARMLDPENVHVSRGRLYHGIGETPPTGLNDFQYKPAEEWWQNVEWVHWVDSRTGKPLPKSRQQPLLEWHPRWEKAATFEDLGDGRIRFTHAIARPPEVGDAFISKGLYMPNRISPGIHLEDAVDVTFEEVTIHHAGGMGLIAQRCENVMIDKMRVGLAEDSKRLVSTCADATHFVLCKGAITLRDSHFEYMLDDAVNVHGLSAVVRKRTGPASLECELMHFQQLGLEFARAGEQLRFSLQSDLVAYGEREVKSYRRVNSSRFEVTFTDPIEDFVKPGSYLDNLDCQPDLTFADNTVINNRARGIIFSTGGRVLVEGNRFENSTMAAILIEGDANNWFESGPVEDVTIRGNTFIDLSPSSYILEFGPNEKGMDSLSDAPFHANIRVLDNVFELKGPRLLRAHRVEGLAFRDNRVETQSDYREFKEVPTIEVVRSTGGQVSDNDFDLPHAPIVDVKP